MTTGIITKTEYKAYAGIASGTTTWDAFLDVIIPAGQAMVEKWLGYAFDTGTRTERYSGPIDSNAIKLKGYPVTSITSVKRFYGTGANDYETLSTDDYTYEPTTSTLYLPGTGRGGQVMVRDDWGELIESDQGASPRFVEGLNNYQVVYVSGYANTAAMPADLQYAMYRLIDAMFSDRRANPTMKSESIGDYSYTKESGARASVASLIPELFAQWRGGAP